MKIINIKYLSLLFLIGLLVSCNNKYKPEEIEYKKWLNPDDKLDLLRLNLNIKVNVDDEFKVYYTEDNTMSFNEDKTVRVKVRGDSLFQDVTFSFPKATKPTNIRIDLGFSREQKRVGYNNMSFEFKDRKFKIEATELLKYFILNDNHLNWDEATASFVMKNLQDETYFPFIYSTASINQPLRKVLSLETD